MGSARGGCRRLAMEMEMGGKLLWVMRPCLPLRSSYGAEESASWSSGGCGGKSRMLRVLRLYEEEACLMLVGT